jgi:hypothetical protein
LQSLPSLRRRKELEIIIMPADDQGQRQQDAANLDQAAALKSVQVRMIEEACLRSPSMRQYVLSLIDAYENGNANHAGNQNDADTPEDHELA